MDWIGIVLFDSYNMSTTLKMLNIFIGEKKNKKKQTQNKLHVYNYSLSPRSQFIGLLFIAARLLE